jgi:hypothetical protein
LGGEKSGITTIAAGWNTAVKVVAKTWRVSDISLKDYFEIYVVDVPTGKEHKIAFVQELAASNVFNAPEGTVCFTPYGTEDSEALDKHNQANFFARFQEVPIIDILIDNGWSFSGTT